LSSANAATGARERRHPAGMDPVHLLGGGKAVYENDRFALAPVKERDPDIVVLKARHDPVPAGRLGR
jgi:hypothetical protein